ncbi:hypothetical protein HDU67_008793 [Dinochytrium kinnereticum]|nr:hypothetical protein HDU67_008793 [Dinochytrium kinnereticum]
MDHLFSNLFGSRAQSSSASSHSASGAGAGGRNALPASSTVLSRLGLPGRHPSPTVTAYDPAQSFVAVGLSDGSILLIGSPPNFEALLPSPTDATRASAVKFIRFKVGDRYLVSINNHDEIVVWNLATGSIQFPPTPVGVPVTSLCVPSGSSGWFYVGLATGQVLVYDALRGMKSTYHVPCLLDQLAPVESYTEVGSETKISDESPGRVVALEACPADANILMIGHASGFIFLWDIKAKACLKRFMLPSRKTADGGASLMPLISACWKPDGSQFVTSHESLIAFWNVKESGLMEGLKSLAKVTDNKDVVKKPIHLRTLEGPVEDGSVTERHPVFKVSWISSNSAQDQPSTALLVSGGTRSAELEGITLFEINGNTKELKGLKPSGFLAIDSKILNFIPMELLETGTETTFGILALTSSNDVRAFKFQTSGFAPAALSPSVEMLSSADILGFTMVVAGPSFLDRLRRELDSRITPLPLKGGAADFLYSVGSRNARPNANDLLLTAHSDSTVKIWQTDDSPLGAQFQPTLLSTLNLKGHINLTKGTPNAPCSTLVNIDPREGVLIVASGTVVLIFKHEAKAEHSRSSSAASRPATAEAKEYTADDVERLMQELDDTIDGVLDELKETRGGEGDTLKTETATIADHPMESETEPVNSDAVDPAPPPPPPPKTDELSKEKIVAKSAPGPQLPPRAMPGPPLPPRDKSSSASREALHGTSGGIEGSSDMVSNPTVVVDRLGRRVLPAIKGWVPYISAIYMNNVASVSFAGWLNVLAVTTTDGTLTIVDASTGKAIFTDIFKDTTEGLPIEIVLLHFAETYFDKEPHTRPVLFVGTADGALFAYGFTEWHLDQPRQILRRISLIKPSTAFLDDPSLFTSYNRPLSLAILNENGVSVTQQSTRAGENYLVFAGSRSATVLLLEPMKPPQLVAERSFVAAVQGPLGNYIVSRRPTPGLNIIQAGIAVLKTGPVILTVTRDGTMTGYSLPSLDVAFETVHAEVGGKNVVDAKGIPVPKHGGPLAGTIGWGLGPLRVKVLEDGRVCCWTGEKELKVLSGICDEGRFKGKDPKLYDNGRQSMWARSTGRLPALSATHTKEADELFEGRRHKEDLAEAPIPSTGAPSHNANHPMAEAKQKIGERGEKLEELEGKFANLADSSKNMVDMLKEYNARQEKKKWWEL